jgi:hypothetical protein
MMASKTVLIVGAGVVVLVGGLVAAVAVPRLIARGPGGAGETAGGGAGLVREDSEGSGAGAREDENREKDAALAALAAELAAAEPYAGRTDEQRLADAWAWVNANRPAGRPYNEVEAKMLALMDVIFDGEERSAEWLMNASLIEVEMLRAMDTDGDGTVSDEEMKMFVDENLATLGGFEHPYIKAKLDTNGDGDVSAEEMEGLERIMSPDGAFAGVLARAQIEAWDSDRDGFLTDGEREAGRAGSGDRIREFVDQQMAAMEQAGMFAGEGGDATRAQTEADIRANMEAAMGGEQAEMMAGMMTAQELMQAMRVENMDQQEMQAEMMSSLPPAPDYGSFDADGDGQVGPGETEAFQRAMNEYQKQVQDLVAEQSARFMRRQFEHATGQSDTNGDGRLTPDEWDRRLEMLLAQRDERLFVRSYDLDGDGGVGQDELMNFVDWHRAGSLRADANYDGVVDARDLEQAMQAYQRQGH